MRTSKAGIDLIKSFEGFSPKACKCVKSEKYYTIGYGHYGADVSASQTITKRDAEKLLARDLISFEAKVNKYMHKYKFTQNQFDALVSFCYNVGNIDGITKKGTRTIKEIANAFLLYNKSGGVVLKGLQNRRVKEKELFESNGRKPVFFPALKCDVTGIIEGLEKVGADSVFTYRRKIAECNGISDYCGSYEQNITLLVLLKKGKLIKPV